MASKSRRSRTCKSCREKLPLSQFEETRTNVFRRDCKTCVSVRRSQQNSESPEAYLKTRLLNLRKQRVHEGISFQITLEDVLSLWKKQDGRCALSGVPLTFHQSGGYGDGKKGEFNASIDRINPNGPYLPDNVQLVAMRVNYMKNILSEEMFFWWVRNLHDNYTKKMFAPPSE